MNSETYRANLNESTFYDADLGGVDFTNAQLVETEFNKASGGGELVLREVIFTNSDLIKTRMENIRFVGCDLSGSQLSGARLTDSTFEGTPLSNAEFEEAILENVTFDEDIDISGVSFYRAKMSELEANHVDFSGAQTMEQVDLDQAEAVGADFTRLDMENAEIKNGIFKDCYFNNANLNSVSFDDSNLSEAEFINTKLENASFEQSELNNTEFSDGSVLAYAQFEAAILSNTLFNQVDLSNAVLDNIKRSSDVQNRSPTAEFIGVTLEPRSQLSLTNAQLDNSRFEDIDSTDIDIKFRDASFIGATISSCVLDGADFSGADLRGIEGQHLSIKDVLFDNANVDEDSTFGKKLKDEKKAESKDPGRHQWLSRTCNLFRFIYPRNKSSEVREQYLSSARQYKRLELLFAENNISRGASQYYYQGQEARRKSARAVGIRRDWFWRFFSKTIGHRVRARNVILLMAIIWFVWGALIFPYVELANRTPSKITPPLLSNGGLQFNLDILIDSLYFSIVTFTSVGYGDFHPADFWAQVAVGIEGILGAVLAVLLGFVLANREAW
jgi:uncharacterized protein YjbI with pentapeptide repeats